MAHEALACLLLSLILAVPLRAEEPPPRALALGMRVRVTAPSLASHPLVGTVSTISGDAIGLAGAAGELVVSVPKASILQLEVSQGRNRRKGALIGGAIAGSLGAILGAVGCHDSSDWNSWACGGILGGFGVGIGAGIGSIVGSGDHWKDLPSDGFGVSLTPTPSGGVGLVMHYTF